MFFDDIFKIYFKLSLNGFLKNYCEITAQIIETFQDFEILTFSTVLLIKQLVSRPQKFKRKIKINF